jgi:hypothetical protein
MDNVIANLKTPESCEQYARVEDRFPERAQEARRLGVRNWPASARCPADDEPSAHLAMRKLDEVALAVHLSLRTRRPFPRVIQKISRECASFHAPDLHSEAA